MYIEKALQSYEDSVSEGYFKSLFCSSDGKRRLDFCYDLRNNPSKRWNYTTSTKPGIMNNQQNLQRSEVVGFMKAKEPDWDIEKALFEFVLKEFGLLKEEVEELKTELEENRPYREG